MTVQFVTDVQAQFGRYVFLKKLAEGGMAEIFLAQRRSFAGFGRFVVIKRLLPEHRGNQIYERLFLDEARIVASLEHPNIVSAYDLGKIGDAYFMVMEYIHGVSGAELLTRAVRVEGGLEYGAAITIVSQIALALDHGFRVSDFDGRAMGIVHHDVSPHNLQIGYDGVVKLLDYGVATQMGRSSARGRRGKYAYMTPEAIRGTPADHRSDLFSLGVVLYEFTVGRRLFKAKTTQETISRIQSGHLPKPTEFHPDYPPLLEAVVMRALQVDPELRFQSGRQFVEALEEVSRGARLLTGNKALAAYMASLYYEEMEVRHDELTTLIGRLDDECGINWTSSHQVNGTGELTALSDSPKNLHPSGVTEPAGRETIELPDAGGIAIFAKPSEPTDSHSIVRIESEIVGDLLGDIQDGVSLPKGVNDHDPDWQSPEANMQLLQAQRVIWLLSGVSVTLAAALLWFWQYS
jgi:serine/threonine protein kinase